MMVGAVTLALTVSGQAETQVETPKRSLPHYDGDGKRTDRPRESRLHLLREPRLAED